MIDSIDDPLPTWAERKSDGNYLEINAQLCTRDGRVIGNAKVTEVDGVNAEVETDKGVKVKLCYNELQELFYRHEYIMK